MLPIKSLARALPKRRLLPVLSNNFTSTAQSYLSSRTDIPSNNNPATPNQQHIPNASSTLTSDVPSVGKAPPPPEFIGSVDPKYTPNVVDSGTGKAGAVSGSVKVGNGPIDASESEWAKFIAEPIKRVGESETTMRARLVYQSRKRGILETDLLLSTFADENLPKMTVDQMREYDAFLDENDWDIYYWCTQDPPVNINESAATVPNIPAKEGAATTDATAYNTSSSRKTASPTYPDDKIQSPPGALGLGSIEQPNMNITDSAADKTNEPIEWAQTVGTVKVAYKPVPERWKNSWVLKAIRDHVEGRRARGVMPPAGEKPKGLGRMPDL
ncbi:hypothetical protein ABW19_dt0201110 [Dactylella cylindrospora]|nr:hypothetical protein ABW19_dt0201110 [Dactylella cylindrospora]